LGNLKIDVGLLPLDAFLEKKWREDYKVYDKKSDFFYINA